MEATFNNKNNVLNATVLNTHDSSPLYSLKTSFTSIRGAKVLTTLRDQNPPLVRDGDNPHPIVGAIHWKEKWIEVRGEKRKIEQVKTKKGALFWKYGILSPFPWFSLVYCCHFSH
jgi:hypothetical protein